MSRFSINPPVERDFTNIGRRDVRNRISLNDTINQNFKPVSLRRDYTGKNLTIDLGLPDDEKELTDMVKSERIKQLAKKKAREMNKDAIGGSMVVVNELPLLPGRFSSPPIIVSNIGRNAGEVNMIDDRPLARIAYPTVSYRV